METKVEGNNEFCGGFSIFLNPFLLKQFPVHLVRKNISLGFPVDLVKLLIRRSTSLAKE